MVGRFRSVNVGVACVGLVAAALATIGAAPQTSQTDPMAALLSEVRALRIAMEQQASIGPRMQLTLARLTIEEQRVTHLTAQVDAVRQQLRARENDAAQSLGSEQNRWIDLNARLDELERSLGPVRK